MWRQSMHTKAMGAILGCGGSVTKALFEEDGERLRGHLTSRCTFFGPLRGSLFGNADKC